MSVPETKPSRLQGLRVLVVDSDAASVKLLQVILENEGCELRASARGKDALIAGAEFRPQLILLELVLPDVSGLDVARSIKADTSTEDAAMVAVTSSDGPETRRLALEAGCIDYVRKPIDVLTFAAHLASLLGKLLGTSTTASKPGDDA